jgi:ribosomal protein S18 acetylase RimI-like enzyme
MKALRHIHTIIGYVLFLLPPFVWGLVELYLERDDLRPHVVSLVVNLIVVALMALIGLILIRKRIIARPTNAEQRHLLFGLSGNVIVYFYTFQNMMEIQNIVTIYLVLLLVIGLRRILITNSIQEWELWILMPIYLLIDTLHLVITGCGVTNTGTVCFPNDVPTWILYVLYVLVALSTLGWYAYKVALYKRYTFFGIANMVLILFIAIYSQEFVTINEKLMGTVAILAVFLVLLDFIVSFVNKTYDHRTLLFYLRTSTFLVLSLLLMEENFWEGGATQNLLILMVFATYVSLGIVILKHLLGVTEEADLLPHRDLLVRPCTEADKLEIQKDYGDVAYQHMRLDDQSLSLVAIQDGAIVGFICTYEQPLYAEIPGSTEAYINIIEVHPDHRRSGIASELIRRTELHFRHQGAGQIRAWSSADKEAAIQLWYRLGYNLSPTTIHIAKINKEIYGVYAVKALR